MEYRLVSADIVEFESKVKQLIDDDYVLKGNLVVTVSKAGTNIYHQALVKHQNLPVGF